MPFKSRFGRRVSHGTFVLSVCVALLAPSAALGQRARRGGAGRPAAARRQGAAAGVRPAWRAALARISAESMRGHLSFIASDALEGRATPSRGLDLAADYIAAQFRRAGLEPLGDDGYFQTANLAPAGGDLSGFEMRPAGGARAFDAPPAVTGPARVTFRAPAQARTPVKARNVAGLLRGSDPRLRDTYVIVSAHYDHVGVRAGCTSGDCIFNGANDDGSGTVGVMEIAAALARLEPKPKRSVLFLTFFGEELGLVGSRYYGRHPLVPLAQTVAQINMEQVGRTDDGEGPQVGTAVVTGLDYSEVGAALRRAGAETGVKVYKHPTKSDAFFSRSDNQPLADLGVPAHTLGVAFEFPDYHGVGDHWEKIDYANMERVVRAVALGVLTLADDAQAPRWDESNPRAAGYAAAWKKLRGQ